MTVLSFGEERSVTDVGSLIERMAVCQCVYVLKTKRRKGRFVGVEEGARRLWGEKDNAALTGCGCAGPGGGVMRQKTGARWLVGEWCAAGFGRR